MSFKDLEAEIRAWAQLEQFAQQQREAAQEAKREAKRLKRARKEAEQIGRPRPALYIPDRPVRYDIDVTLGVRKVENGKMSDLLEVTFTISTLSLDDAEVQARKQAKQAGFILRGTVAVERKGN